MMTGSLRIVDHNTFVELQWQRDPFAKHHYQLPSGFRSVLDALSPEFIAILEDIHALQCIRAMARIREGPDPLKMAYINNHQASIQSRMAALTGLTPMLECTRLAAYLCSSMLCCRVWCGLVIPVRQAHSKDFCACHCYSLILSSASRERLKLRVLMRVSGDFADCASNIVLHFYAVAPEPPGCP